MLFPFPLQVVASLINIISPPTAYHYYDTCIFTQYLFSITGVKTDKPGSQGYIPSIFPWSSAHSQKKGRCTVNSDTVGKVTPLAWCEDSWRPPETKQVAVATEEDERKAREATAAVWKETGHDYVKTTSVKTSDVEERLHKRIQELEQENENLRKKVLSLDGVKHNDKEFQ